MNTPDQRPALQALNALYGRRAAIYDYELMPVAPLRREAIAALALEPGQTVLDIGAVGLRTVSVDELSTAARSFTHESMYQVDWVEVAVISAFSLGMACFWSLLPAWRASKIDPVEALRYE